MSNPFVRRLEYGAALDDADRAALAYLTRKVGTYDPRSVLVPEGEPAPHMLVVLAGWACRYKYLHGGERQITDLILPGDACHPQSVLLAHADHGFAALGACRVAEVDPGELASTLGQRPRVARALHWSSLQTESILREVVTNIGRRLAEPRIAHLICEVRARLSAVGLVNADDSFAWPLTQDDVGDITGLTNVHINRTLKALRAVELIALEGRRMRVPDPTRLAAHCSFRPGYLHLGPHITPGSTRTASGHAPVLLPPAHP